MHIHNYSSPNLPKSITRLKPLLPTHSYPVQTLLNFYESNKKPTMALNHAKYLSNRPESIYYPINILPF